MDSSRRPTLRCAKLWSLLASNTMKSSLSSCRILVLAAALLVLKPFTGSAETFTEGVRVSPETVKLKTGEYVWEPERAPEGPLLIVASTTEQVAYVYRNGIRIARSSVSTGRPGHPTPHRGFHDLGKGSSSYLEHLQRCGDAVHGARDLGRHRAARRQSARLPRLAWLHPAATRIFQATFWRHHERRDRDHCRHAFRAGRNRASGLVLHAERRG